MTAVADRQRRVASPKLGRMLIEARTRKGLGLREAARLAGIGADYLLRLEKERRVPSRSVARGLAAAFGLEGDELNMLLDAAVLGGRDIRQVSARRARREAQRQWASLHPTERRLDRWSR
ncbi:helix-turn-helix domain-containing protein [Streptomyces sp. NPDC001118]